MLSRRRHFGRGIVRRLIGLALLLSVCSSFIPVPMGIGRSSEKDQSQPFPCMNRPCGCASAEQCWKQCCCFTNAQKVAWATQHGVTPPAYVVEAARAETEVKVATKTGSPKSSCSLCKSAAVCETSAVSKRSGACCDSQKQTARCSRLRCCDDVSEQGHSPLAKSSGANGSVRYVIGVEMMKCRGQGMFWSSLPWAVITEIVVPEFRVDPSGWDNPQSDVANNLAPDPPEPPPRLA